MKYTILINQLVWQYYYPKANFKHAILFEAIKGMCDSPNMIKINDFTWIASKKLLNELPMLQLKTIASLSKTIKDLESWKLIERRIDNETNYYYYRITGKGDLLNRNDLSKNEIDKIINQNKKVFRKVETSPENVNNPHQKHKQPSIENINNPPQKNKCINITKDSIINSPIINNKNGKFKKPTINEIQIYCNERKNKIDPQGFFDHYETRGWIPRGYTTQMKDWKAAVRTWERNSSKYNSNINQKSAMEKNWDDFQRSLEHEGN